MSCKFGSLLFLFMFCVVVAEESCKVGTCMDLQDCPGLLNIVSYRTIIALEVYFSRQCGFKNLRPFVCCTEEEKRFKTNKGIRIFNELNNNRKNYLLNKFNRIDFKNVNTINGKVFNKNNILDNSDVKISETNRFINKYDLNNNKNKINADKDNFDKRNGSINTLQTNNFNDEIENGKININSNEIQNITEGQNKIGTRTSNAEVDKTTNITNKIDFTDRKKLIINPPVKKVKNKCRIGTCTHLKDCPKIEKILSSRTIDGFKLYENRKCGDEKLQLLVCCTEEEINFDKQNVTKVDNNTHNKTNHSKWIEIIKDELDRKNNRTITDLDYSIDTIDNFNDNKNFTESYNKTEEYNDEKIIDAIDSENNNIKNKSNTENKAMHDFNTENKKNGKEVGSGTLTSNSIKIVKPVGAKLVKVNPENFYLNENKIKNNKNHKGKFKNIEITEIVYNKSSNNTNIVNSKNMNENNDHKNKIVTSHNDKLDDGHKNNDFTNHEFQNTITSDFKVTDIKNNTEINNIQINNDKIINTKNSEINNQNKNIIENELNNNLKKEISHIKYNKSNLKNVTESTFVDEYQTITQSPSLLDDVDENLAIINWNKIHNNNKVTKQHNCNNNTNKYKIKNEANKKNSYKTTVDNEKNKSTSINLLPEDCGSELSNRIVGGNRTEPGELPWMALLEFRKQDGSKLLACGGALINDRYVLTAAHCVKRRGTAASWKLEGVRLGEYNISVTNQASDDYDNADEDSDDYDYYKFLYTNHAVSIGIEEEIFQEKYTTDDEHNDIALLRLAYNVNFTDYVKPICLPETSKIDSRLMVAGWGRTETTAMSDVKLKVTLPLVQRDVCQNVYTNEAYNPKILDESQICAGGEKGKDTCANDSGGPLMQLNKRSDLMFRWEVVGVVSFGPVWCGREGWPGVYTNVSYYMPWILSKLRP